MERRLTESDKDRETVVNKTEKEKDTDGETGRQKDKREKRTPACGLVFEAKSRLRKLDCC